MAKINIGGYELDSAKLPQEGLDYSKFDLETQLALSVFDTDSRKGHLSVKELQNAISFFASQDGVSESQETTDTVIIKHHKKDGKIDKYEYEKTQAAYSDKVKKNAKQGKSEKAATIATAKKIISMTGVDLSSLSEDVIDRIQTLALLKAIDIVEGGNVSMQSAVDAIGRAIEAEKRGLKATDIAENVYKSKDNKFYTYINGNFYPADSKGNCRVNEKINDKGQIYSARYNSDGDLLSVRALNYQNKPYINPEYAAKVLGFRYDKNSNTATGGFNLSDTNMLNDKRVVGFHYDFKWDDKKHAFICENGDKGIAQLPKIAVSRDGMRIKGPND